MSHLNARPPAWVYKRDGRLVAFEADKISADLYAASEHLGEANAFLARELTDGVLHFLPREFADQTPSSVQIAEFVAKVTRELGHPRLAQAFLETKQPTNQTPSKPAQQKPRSRTVQFRFSTLDARDEIQRECLTNFSLSTIYSRDIAASHRDGLITLSGLDHPAKLAGTVLRSSDMTSAAESIRVTHTAQQRVASYIALDGVPAVAFNPSGRPAETLDLILASIQLPTIVNFNRRTQSPREESGPLFENLQSTSETEHFDAWCELLASHSSNPRLEVSWHLSEGDFRERQKLVRLGRLILDHPRLGFALDRPRLPVALGTGLDREKPAVLSVIALRLPRLIERLQVTTPKALLEKLPTLSHMAVSAGVQKRNYLRRQPDLNSGFFVDRARLVVIPAGLETVVETLQQKPDTVRFVRDIIARLHDDLRTEGLAKNIDVELDLSFVPLRPLLSSPEDRVDAQIDAAAKIFDGIAPSTATISLDESSMPSAETLANLLQRAWNNTGVTHIRFSRRALQQASLNLQ